MHRAGSLAEKRTDPESELSGARVAARPPVDPELREGCEPAAERSFIDLDDGQRLAAFSPAMRELRRQIEQVAPTDAAVLLVGESGTGKDIVARAIHKLSGRSARWLQKVSCAAQPAEQLEANLFGSPSDKAVHEPGLLELFHSGTLVIDEVAEMPLATQARLLHALSEDAPIQAGRRAPAGSQARLLTTAGDGIRKAVEEGTLRADLYYRLSVFTLRVPPLRERREDLPHLLHHLIEIWSEAFLRPRLPVTRRILDACAGYAWPGNVRELENFVKRYLVLGDEKAALDQLDGGAESHTGAPSAEGAIQILLPARTGGLDLKLLMRDIKKDAERAAIAQALERTGGNKQKAARLLRISLRSLHYKVRAYQIESAHDRDPGRLATGAPALRPAAAPASPSTPSGKVITMDRALPAAS